MSMLNFKHGLYKNLPQQISNGTIYVTTDEKAMYVDLEGSRIRLSQIINVPNTTAWQELTPPYSTEAFYYIVDANALLKYTGSNWVQINSTAEIDGILESLGFHGSVASLDAVTNPTHGDIYRVGTQSYVYNNNITEGSKWVAIDKIGAEIVDIEAAVAALNTTIASHGTAIENLGKDLDAAELNIEHLKLITGFKGKVEELPTTDVVVGDIYLVGNLIKVCTKIADGAPVWEEAGNESARIEALKAEIAKVKAEAGTAEGVQALQEEVTRIAGLVDDATTGLAATKKVADDAADAIADYDAAHADDYDNNEIDSKIGAVLGEETDAAGTNTVYGAKALAAAAQEAASGAQDDIDAILEGSTAKTIKEVEDRIKSIEDVNATLSDTYIDEDELAEAADAIRGKVTVTDESGATSEVVFTGTLASVDSKVTENTTAIAEQKQALEDLESKVDRELQTADAMVFKGTVAAESGLPTENVGVGDTYKATEEFTMANGIKVYVGDLLIASGEETDNVITSELTWNHVPSGYVADYNPKMKLVHVEDSNTVDVNLTSAHADTDTAGDLGDFQISGAEGSAVTVSVANGNNIAIGMTWGTF